MSRKFLIVIIGLGLALAAAVIWWWAAPAAPSQPAPASPAAMPAVSPAAPAPVPPTPQEVAQTSLKNTALRFAEIYGSYSTDAKFANLKAINGLISESMKQSVAAGMAAGAPSQGFYGVTTRALLANIENETNETALVTVSTQRQELFSGQGELQLRYQNLRLSLVRQGEAWLVDGADWQ